MSTDLNFKVYNIDKKECNIKDTIHKSDSILTVINKICISDNCSKNNLLNESIYIWYYDKNDIQRPLSFYYKNQDNKYNNDIIYNIREFNVDNKFIKNDTIIDNYIEYLDNILIEDINDIKDNNIYYVFFPEYIEKIDIYEYDNNIYYGFIKKYWPKINIKDKLYENYIKYIKDKKYIERFKQLSDILKYNKLQFELYDKYSKNINYNPKFSYDIIKLKINTNSLINIEKLFDDIYLNNIILFSKLVLGTFKESYYKIYKPFINDNIETIEKPITQYRCNNWILGDIEIIYGKTIREKLENILILKLYIENKFIVSLYIWKSGIIEIIINKKDIISNLDNILDDNLIKSAINNVNIFLETIKNKLYGDIDTFIYNKSTSNWIKYSQSIDFKYEYNKLNSSIRSKRIETMDNINIDRTKFIILLRNLNVFCRYIESEELNNDIIIRFKRVSNYAKIDNIENQIIKLYNQYQKGLQIDDIELLKKKIIKNIQLDFELSKDDVKEKVQYIFSKIESNKNYRIDKKTGKKILKESDIDPGSEIIFNENDNIITISVKNCKNENEINRIKIFLKFIINVYSKYINNDLDSKYNIYLESLQDWIDISDKYNNNELTIKNMDQTQPDIKEDDEIEDDIESNSDIDSDIDSDLDSEIDSDMGGGSYLQFGGEGYILNRLKQKKRDPSLFKWTQKDWPDSIPYVKKCTPIDRHPIVLDDDELQYINKNESIGSGEKSYGNIITLGSSESKKFHYICPKYWDISRNISLDPNKMVPISKNGERPKLKPDEWYEGDIISMKEAKSNTKSGIIVRDSVFWKDAKDVNDYHVEDTTKRADPWVNPLNNPMPCCFNLKNNEAVKIKNKIEAPKNNGFLEFLGESDVNNYLANIIKKKYIFDESKNINKLLKSINNKYTNILDKYISDINSNYQNIIDNIYKENIINSNVEVDGEEITKTKYKKQIKSDRYKEFLIYYLKKIIKLKDNLNNKNNEELEIIANKYIFEDENKYNDIQIRWYIDKFLKINKKIINLKSFKSLNNLLNEFNNNILIIINSFQKNEWLYEDNDNKIKIDIDIDNFINNDKYKKLWIQKLKKNYKIKNNYLDIELINSIISFNKIYLIIKKIFANFQSFSIYFDNEIMRLNQLLNDYNLYNIPKYKAKEKYVCGYTKVKLEKNTIIDCFLRLNKYNITINNEITKSKSRIKLDINNIYNVQAFPKNSNDEYIDLEYFKNNIINYYSGNNKKIITYITTKEIINIIEYTIDIFNNKNLKTETLNKKIFKKADTIKNIDNKLPDLYVNLDKLNKLLGIILLEKSLNNWYKIEKENSLDRNLSSDSDDNDDDDDDIIKLNMLKDLGCNSKLLDIFEKIENKSELNIALNKFDLDILKSLYKSNTIFKKNDINEYEKWGNYCDIKYILYSYTKIYKFNNWEECSTSLLNLFTQCRSITIYISSLIDSFVNTKFMDIFKKDITNKLLVNDIDYWKSSNGDIYNSFYTKDYNIGSLISIVNNSKRILGTIKNITVNNIDIKLVNDKLISINKSKLDDKSFRVENYINYIYNINDINDLFFIPVMKQIYPEFYNSNIVVFENKSNLDRIKIPFNYFNDIDDNNNNIYIYKYGSSYELVRFQYIENITPETIENGEYNISSKYLYYENDSNIFLKESYNNVKNLLIDIKQENTPQINISSFNNIINILYIEWFKKNKDELNLNDEINNKLYFINNILKYYINNNKHICHIIYDNFIIPIYPEGINKYINNYDTLIFDYKQLPKKNIEEYIEFFDYLNKLDIKYKYNYIKNEKINVSINESNNIINILLTNNTYVLVNETPTNDNYHISSYINLFELDNLLYNNDIGNDNNYLDNIDEFNNQNIIFNIYKENILIYLYHNIEFKQSINNFINNYKEINNNTNIIMNDLYILISNITDKLFIFKNIKTQYNTNINCPKINTNICEKPCINDNNNCVLEIQSKSNYDLSNIKDKFIYKFIQILINNGYPHSNNLNSFFIINPSDFKNNINKLTEIYYDYNLYSNSKLKDIYSPEAIYYKNINLYGDNENI